MPPGAASGEQQQRWRPLVARSLQDALSRHAVPASVRGSAFALRATPCDAASQSGVERAEMHTALCERRSGTAYLSLYFSACACERHAQMCGA